MTKKWKLLKHNLNKHFNHCDQQNRARSKQRMSSALSINKMARLAKRTATVRPRKTSREASRWSEDENRGPPPSPGDVDGVISGSASSRGSRCGGEGEEGWWRRGVRCWRSESSAPWATSIRVDILSLSVSPSSSALFLRFSVWNSF